ncbi:penicillin acylase family protein [Pseudomarimonas salicorniae]|uniref:Penicillin acylase family protein n=1 Tax=Pseudomarimonas salicorniae TaxID=2933270 RepID=A0ABT0GGN7_9GAMM|nr:penicillin acylase family protein [Lysobacter sp. CAU 1642]MCK7593703.1 penicillin acylase family protein [Lysobacter sp. CAU 1642]
MLRRWTIRIVLFALLALVLAALVAMLSLRGSLARLDGELALPGLSAEARVYRDRLGVVTVEAANEADMARALGYVHAQERFFEMDLLRRSAAGELSALFGPAAIEADRRLRIHRLRSRVEQQLPALLGAKAEVLRSYTEGVNAGLEALSVRPWPYLLLRQSPQPWQMSDSMLVGYAMFFDLQDELNQRELALWRIREVVPPALYALLSFDGTEWDAPLLGEARGNVPLPDAATLDLRQLPMPEGNIEGAATPAVLGSNNFAVDGRLSKDGRAIVADDMHLGLRAPNIWFRAQLRYADPDAPDGRVDVGGFSLPGIPAIIVGSNGHIAWAFTNSYGDWADWREVDANDPITSHQETIEVAGAESIAISVRETAWGPIVHEADGAQPALALRWVTHQPGSLDLGLAELARSRDWEDAVTRIGDAGIPHQNLLIGDSSGAIAWRLVGRIPDRAGGCDAAVPVRNGSPCQWSGWKHGGENPGLLDLGEGRLWTANARVADGEALALIGDGGYALGARARQIRDALFARDRFDEQDLLAIQLDDRTLFLERWYKAFRNLVESAEAPALRRLEAATRQWDERASAEAVSYRIVRAWRIAVIDRINDGLTAPARAALGDDFIMPSLPQLEGVAWQLIEQRPPHLLPRRFDSWNALLIDAATDIERQLSERGPLAERTWGERNTANICHPLARALPSPARRWLCMPAEPLDGDTNMPRVAAPSFGASQRMVVAPGREIDGIIHMPGGQSGHPLSPFWGAGHDDWVHGRPSGFSPGKPEHQLTLRPGEG